MICYQKNRYHLRNVQVLSLHTNELPHLEQKLFPTGDLYMEPCHGKLKNIPSNKGTLKKKQTKEL